MKLINWIKRQLLEWKWFFQGGRCLKCGKPIDDPDGWPYVRCTNCGEKNW